MATNRRFINLNQTDAEVTAGTNAPATVALAAPGSGNSAEFTDAQYSDAALFMLEVPAIAAGGSLVVKLQGKNPLTGNWIDIPSAAFTAVTAATTTPVELVVNPLIYTSIRAAWTLTGGTTCSFAICGILSYGKNSK